MAIATASGRGGVGVVRLSGPSSKTIAQKIFRPSGKRKVAEESHKLVHGEVIDPGEGRAVDDGLVAFMAGPNSYTGEDVVEFQLHGSGVVLSRVVEICHKEGARMAAPGEFTRRAYCAGRIDLVQAEAVAELIHAASEAEAEAARRRLSGNLSTSLQKLAETVKEVLAEVEAAIDFPEEGLEGPEQAQISEKLEYIQLVTNNLQGSYRANQRLTEGYRVVLAGRPNVGKSSLFNNLLEMERAIVTEQPGTTRDSLREELVLGGRRVRLVDTAGLREESDDPVERLGVERTGGELKEADLVWLVLSSPEGLTKEDQRRLAGWKEENVWLVWNKIDLRSPPPEKVGAHKTFAVSAQTGEGVGELRKQLTGQVKEETTAEGDGGIGNQRQKELLEHFAESVNRGVSTWKDGRSAEFVAFEWREAYRHVSALLGRGGDVVEEILDEIFSRFCIGK